MSRHALWMVLALCALSTAMYTRNRRALPESQEQHEAHDVPNKPETPQGKQICAPATPCAWVVYRPFVREIEYNFTNNYCECAPGTKCLLYNDDISISAYEHRCKRES